MTTKILASSFGAATPYVVSASLVFSVVPQTAATRPSISETSFYKISDRSYTHVEPIESASAYYLVLDRPDLMPIVIVPSVYPYALDTYEPFIISEGWREEASVEGPFLVEEDRRPVIVFDDYDLSAIGIYEQN